MAGDLADEIKANVKRANEATRLRAVQTPDDVKVALQAVGHALDDELARAHYTTIRQYIGFLQMTCAVNLPASSDDAGGASSDSEPR